jgi:antitoxin VapB
MTTAKLFQNGRSQAARLPKAYRFSGDKVIIKRFGKGVVLLPDNASWDCMIEATEKFSTDFMETRDQGGRQEREACFE